MELKRGEFVKAEKKYALFRGLFEIILSVSKCTANCMAKNKQNATSSARMNFLLRSSYIWIRYIDLRNA
jgi:hypothetical protein